MEEQVRKKKFNEILKIFIENNENQKSDLNEESIMLLDKTKEVLDIIESNWNDLKSQRKTNPLTAEEWAIEKCKGKKNE